MCPACTKWQSVQKALGQERALPLWPSSSWQCAGCSKQRPPARSSAGIRGERAHSGWHLPTACLDRPHGASPRITRAGPLPACKRGYLAAKLLHQKLSVQFRACPHAGHKPPVLMAHGDQLIQAPYCSDEETGQHRSHGAFREGVKLCPSEEWPEGGG